MFEKVGGEWEWNWSMRERTFIGQVSERGRIRKNPWKCWIILFLLLCYCKNHIFVVTLLLLCNVSCVSTGPCCTMDQKLSEIWNGSFLMKSTTSTIQRSALVSFRHRFWGIPDFVVKTSPSVSIKQSSTVQPHRKVGKITVFAEIPLIISSQNSCCSLVIIIIIIIALKGAIWDVLQSSQSIANRLQHIRSSSPGAIVCKSHATHPVLITCNM